MKPHDESIRKYDLHTHTKYSLCSTIDPAKTVKQAKKRGLSGIAITDHNTMKGALQAKRSLGRDKEFTLILGEEIKTDHGEILGYYLNEELKKGKVLDVIDSIKEQGGIAGLPHPFSRGLIRKSIVTNAEEKDFKEIIRRIDFVEVLNGRTSSKENAHAKTLAKENKKSQTGGSDGHFLWEIGRAYTVTNDDLRKALLKRSTLAMGTNTLYPLPRTCSFAVRKFRRLSF